MIDELDEVVPYIKKNKCVFFVGAGLSSIAGCFDWKSLVEDMLSDPIIRSEMPNISTDSSEFSSNYQDILGLCMHTFEKANQRNKFWKYIAKSLDEDPEAFQNKYFPLIRKIMQISPFPEIVLTTNVDDLLEKKGLLESFKMFYKVNDFNLDINSDGIFHIHGFIHHIEKSVFLRKQYTSRYTGNRKFRKFLSTISKDYSILFLGKKLEAPMMDILSKFKGDNKHFLLTHNNDETIKDSDSLVFESEFNVKVIKYGEKDELLSLLTSWIDGQFPANSLFEPKESDLANI